MSYFVKLIRIKLDYFYHIYKTAADPAISCLLLATGDAAKLAPAMKREREITDF